MTYNKGITLILAFISFTGMLGIDKFYTGNYILGSIQSLLTISYIGATISFVWNILTICSLLILIFTNYNLLPYVSWGVETTTFDYTVAIVITIYIIIKYSYINYYYNNYLHKN